MPVHFNKILKNVPQKRLGLEKRAFWCVYWCVTDVFYLFGSSDTNIVYQSSAVQIYYIKVNDVVCVGNAQTKCFLRTPMLQVSDL